MMAAMTTQKLNCRGRDVRKKRTEVQNKIKKSSRVGKQYNKLRQGNKLLSSTYPLYHVKNMFDTKFSRFAPSMPIDPCMQNLLLSSACHITW